VESSCECSNEPSGSIKFWETIEWLHNWWALIVLSSIELVSWLVGHVVVLRKELVIHLEFSC
jgi:hypothetical protein